MKWIKQTVKFAAVTGMAVIIMASTAFAAGWVQETGSQPGSAHWQYDSGNGQYYAGSQGICWKWECRNGTNRKFPAK